MKKKKKVQVNSVSGRQIALCRHKVDEGKVVSWNIDTTENDKVILFRGELDPLYMLEVNFRITRWDDLRLSRTCAFYT